jgi:DNA-binding transcriptional MerR regulator
LAFGLTTGGESIDIADHISIVGRARDGRARGYALGRTESPMTIGQVAREFGVTPRALRFYEARRLIAPQRNGSSRLYGRSDRDRIALVLTGRRLGFTLEEIKRLLDGPDGKSLSLTREKCVEQINFLERQKRDIERALGELRQIYSSFYKPSPEQ